MHRAHAVGADALCALGRPKEALARADESIRIDPNGPCPRMARGTILVRSGRRAEGIRPYEISADAMRRARRAAPSRPWPLRQAAGARERSNAAMRPWKTAERGPHATPTA